MNDNDSDVRSIDHASWGTIVTVNPSTGIDAESMDLPPLDRQSEDRNENDNRESNIHNNSSNLSMTNANSETLL